MCSGCSQDINKIVADDETASVFDDESLEKHYEQLKNEITKLQHAIYLETLESYADQGIITKISSNALSEFLQSIGSIIETVYVSGQSAAITKSNAEMTALESVASADYAVDFELVSDIASSYATDTAGDLITNVSDSTKQHVKEIVEDALLQGRSQQKLTEVINNQFEDFSVYRSELIAQQEVTNAFGGGEFAQFQENSEKFGVTGWKHCRTHSDGKVRESHLANEAAGWIPMNVPFPGTGTMHYPHGFRCRCYDDQVMFLPEGETPGNR